MDVRYSLHSLTKTFLCSSTFYIKINISYIKSPKGVILVVLIASERAVSRSCFRPNPFIDTSFPMSLAVIEEKIQDIQYNPENSNPR